MTSVRDTVFRADGTPALLPGARLWQAPPINVTLGHGGALKRGADAECGDSLTTVVVYQLGPGEVRTEYWVVPTTSPANLVTVRTVPGSVVATRGDLHGGGRSFAMPACG